MSNINTQIIIPPNGELNENCVFKLAGYHQLICQAVETELTLRGQSIASCVERGFAWALTSVTMEVLRPIRSCAPISAATWISVSRPPYARREVLFQSAAGEEILRASLFSVPLDIHTRKILTDRERLGDDTSPQGDILISDALARLEEPRGYEPCCTRRVMPSDIDALGHMNNCRYGSFVYDALPYEYRVSLGSPFRYTIDFRRQLSENGSADISCCNDGSAFYVKGTIPQGGKVSFSASLKELSVRTNITMP